MKSKKKILRQIEALIARTSSDSEEEARTSAVLACRLIQKHNLRIVDTDDSKKLRTPTKQDIEDILRNVQDVVESTGAFCGEEYEVDWYEEDYF